MNKNTYNNSQNKYRSSNSTNTFNSTRNNSNSSNNFNNFNNNLKLNRNQDFQQRNDKQKTFYSRTNNNDNCSSYQQNNIKEIIDYIYCTIELGNFKYSIMEYEDDLCLLSRQKHYVSANFAGTNNLLVFIKIRQIYYSCMIDRKTMTYNRNQIKLENIKITRVNVRADMSIYNGTIFDGIFVQNKKQKKGVFVINDIYYFRGSNTTNDNILTKYENVKEFLDRSYKADEQSGNIHLTIGKLYEMTNIRKLLDDMDKSKGYDFRGITFYPEISGTKLLFINGNESRNAPIRMEDKTDRYMSEIIMPDTIKTGADNLLNKSKNVRYKFYPKTNKDVYSVLEVRKTKNIDVYSMLCVDRLDDASPLKMIRLGIALIPDIKCSNDVKNVLNSKKHGRALFKCIFNAQKNKWIPIEEIKDKNLPSFMFDIKKDMDVVIDVDSDEDDETNN